jgi:hypothetical protein
MFAAMVSFSCSVDHGDRFLLAKVHLDHVLKQQTKREVLDAIHSLKFDLSCVYAHTMERIQPTDFKILHWVLYAKGMLTLDELLFALGIKSGRADFDPYLDLPPSTVLHRVSGLLTLDDKSNTIRFVHPTVKDYLIEKSSVYFPAGHSLLAEITLTYLNFQALSSHSTLVRFKAGGDLNGLLDYSLSHWGDHVRESNSAILLASARNWVLSEKFMHAQTLREELMGPSFLSRKRTPLEECSYFGLTPLVVELLQSEYNFRISSTALHLASRGGHVDVVKALLQHPNIDVNLHDEEGRTALSLAASSGNIDIVNLLLDLKDVDTNAVDKDGYSPLSLASLHGNYEVVRILLQHGANINLAGNDGRTPLHCATHQGHLSIVEFLVRHPDVQINIENAEGWTPLTEAVLEGHAEVVRLLLQQDNIDWKSSRIGETECWESIRLKGGVTGRHALLPKDLIAELGISLGDSDVIDASLETTTTGNQKYIQ